MENKTYYLGGSLETERAHQRERLAALAAERAAANAALMDGPSLLDILGVKPAPKPVTGNAWVLQQVAPHFAAIGNGPFVRTGDGKKRKRRSR
jgi:hypothetical protein